MPWRAGCNLALIALLLAAGISQFAEHHWLAELFTHFPGIYFLTSLATLFVCLIRRIYAQALLAVLLLAWNGYALWPLIAPSPAAAPQAQTIRILQFNLLYTDDDIDARVHWIDEQSKNIDVIVLLEVTPIYDPFIKLLRTRYPYVLTKLMRGFRGVAVFSRLPQTTFDLHELEAEKTRFAVMHAMTEHHQPIRLFIAHPPPPISPELARRRIAVLSELANAVQHSPDKLTFVIGDLNLTRWSPYFKNLERAGNLRDSFEGMGIKRTWPSFLPPFIGLMIDHLLVPREVAVTEKVIGPALGSDHRPVITTLQMPY